MDSRLLFAAAAALLLAVSAPALALETVTLPQNPDGTPNFQDPSAAQPDRSGVHFSTDQTGSSMKVDGLGTFHFSANQNSDWLGDPNRGFQTERSTGSALDDAKTPGSEFYNPFGH